MICNLNAKLILSILILSILITGATAIVHRPPPTPDYPAIAAFNSVDNESLAIYRGQNALQAGKYSQALVAYEEAISYNPSYATTWYLKAYTLFKMNRSDEALSAIEHAVLLEPTDRDITGLRDEILITLGRKTAQTIELGLGQNQETTPEFSGQERSSEQSSISFLLPLMSILFVIYHFKRF